MSIYRGWKAHDNFTPEHRNDPEPIKNAPVHVRKAKPLESLLPRTANWIATLPQGAQPQHLAKQFARIANHLCATWDQPAECRRYLDDLMVDTRGGRKGFPAEVIGDLLRLRRLHAEQYPTIEAAWQIPNDEQTRSR